jgi:aryl-alcohol dehydrogenase-like predicted oxidoreductase
MLDRSIEKSVIPTCARHGLGLVVWSPLAQGILTGKYNDGVPAGTRGETTQFLDRELTEVNIARVRKLEEVASDLNITAAQLALAWVLRRSEISSAITGATRPEHVRENVAASSVTLEQDILDRINAILA